MSVEDKVLKHKRKNLVQVPWIQLNQVSNVYKISQIWEVRTNSSSLLFYKNTALLQKLLCANAEQVMPVRKVIYKPSELNEFEKTEQSEFL